MLNATRESLRGEHLIVHSDRSFHYRPNSRIQIMDETRLIRFVTKKACCPDNFACEGLFRRLKNEMFYNRKWVGISINEFVEILHD